MVLCGGADGTTGVCGMVTDERELGVMDTGWGWGQNEGQGGGDDIGTIALRDCSAEGEVAEEMRVLGIVRD